MKKRLFALILAMTMITGAFAGCGSSNDTTKDTPSTEQTTKSEEGDKTTPTSTDPATATVYLETDPETLDFSKAVQADDVSLGMETMDALTRFIDGKIQPAGAESWDISEDGLVYTFHLRDYNWSDGQPVTANDFVYAFQRMFQPDVACPNVAVFYCIEGGEAYNTNQGSVEDVGVKAIDDKTFEITLNKPLPYFIELTKFPCAAPLRKDIVEAEGMSYGSDPSKMVFCGPFVVDSWTKGSQIVLKKNPTYWDADNIKIDVINMPLIQEEQTRQQMFDSGAIDAIKNAKEEYIKQLAPRIESGEVVELKSEYPSSGYVVFNTQDSANIFTNAKVRKAFSLALDRESYVNNILKKDVVAYGFVPYGVNIGDPDFRRTVEEPLLASKEQDPKALLEEGLKELGLDPSAPLEVEYLQSNANADTRSKGEFFQDQWQKKLGVTVKVDTAADSADFNNRVNKGNFQIATTGWGGDYNDPMTFMQLFTTGDGNNSALFSNARYDELVNACMVEQDQQKRLEMFAEAEKILVDEEAAIAPLTYHVAINYVNSRLEGIQMKAGGPQFELMRASIAE